MAARRLATAVIVFGWCAVTAVAQYPGSVRPASRPAGPLSDAPVVPSPPPVGELPPFLSVPQPVVAPPKLCPPCPNDYDPHHVYLPDPSVSWGSGGCEGECGPCRLSWFSADFFVGCTKDLADINRGLAYGIKLGGGHWFSDDKSAGVDLGFFNTHDTYREVLPFGAMITSPVTFTTADVNLRGELVTFDHWRVDGLVGYRYAQLHEKQTLFTLTSISDLAARNEVHAGQVGVIAEYKIGSYFAEMFGKLAIGRNSSSVTFNGFRFTDSVTCCIPELGIRCGYQLGQGCWGTLGYSFLYMSNVERPGRGDTDFFLHGLLIGIENRF